VTVDATHLYWTNRSQGTVKRANLDGTNPQTLLDQNQPQAVAVDANYVYWSNLWDQTGAIRRANLVDGTNPQVFIPNTGSPQLLAFTPPPPPALGVTPSPYDFEEVRTREAASQSFTLANSGGRATGPLTVTLKGAAAFTTTGDTCTGTSLAPGVSCTVTVRFGPTSLGAVTATLTAASKTPAVSATAGLTGTGVGRLYWVNNGQTAADGSVNLANPDGSNAHTLPSTGDLPFPWGVAVDANHLYVAVHGDLVNDPEFEPFILSAENDDLDSYSKPFVFVGVDAQDDPVPQQLAIDANNPNYLYWRTQDGKKIWRGNINDGSFQNIVNQDTWTSGGGLAVDANYLYWTNFERLEGDGTIWRANLDGTNPLQLVQGQNAPRGVAVDASHLYWANVDGTIMRANLDGAFPQQIVPNQKIPQGVAVDATYLYWTNNGDNTIWRANLDGTNPQRIISGQNNPVTIAVSS
jgi:hypothetical protein